MQCGYGGLGLIDNGQLPKERVFLARCTCGALVNVTDGQIAFHEEGENQLVPA